MSIALGLPGRVTTGFAYLGQRTRLAPESAMVGHDSHQFGIHFRLHLLLALPQQVIEVDMDT